MCEKFENRGTSSDRREKPHVKNLLVMCFKRRVNMKMVFLWLYTVTLGEHFDMPLVSRCTLCEPCLYKMMCRRVKLIKYVNRFTAAQWLALLPHNKKVVGSISDPCLFV